MDGYAGYGSYGTDPVPDMVKQFVVYFYRHIRCLLCAFVNRKHLSDLSTLDPPVGGADRLLATAESVTSEKSTLCTKFLL